MGFTGPVVQWHRCLACELEVIPGYRAFCNSCYGQLPWRLRADVMHALRLLRAGGARHELEVKLTELDDYLGRR